MTDNSDICILFVAVIIVYAFIKINSTNILTADEYNKKIKNNKEDFYSSYDFGNTPSYNMNFNYNYGTYSSDCKAIKSANDCISKVNCGICSSDEHPNGVCVAGDQTGPYFRPKSTCNKWEYTNYPANNSSSNILWPPYNWWGSSNWLRKYKWDKPYEWDRWEDWKNDYVTRF